MHIRFIANPANYRAKVTQNKRFGPLTKQDESQIKD
jgi:hypothetical protein